MVKRFFVWVSLLAICACAGVLIWIFLSAPKTRQTAGGPPKAAPEAVEDSPIPIPETRPTTTPRKITDAEYEKARSLALAAAAHGAAEGFHIREDYWGGTYTEPFEKAIVHNLFKGNEYLFWMASDRYEERISIHVYDQDGRLVEVEAWQHPPIAAVRLVPTRSGKFFVIVKVSAPLKPRPEMDSHWIVIYAFR